MSTMLYLSICLSVYLSICLCVSNEGFDVFELSNNSKR